MEIFNSFLLMMRKCSIKYETTEKISDRMKTADHRKIFNQNITVNKMSQVRFVFHKILNK